MNGAIALLVVNMAVSGMFAACYILISILNSGRRHAYVFGISYLIGMLSPLSEIAIYYNQTEGALPLLSPAALLGGVLTMSAALSLFERARPNWTAIAAIGIGGITLRLLIWGGPRDQLVYELLYQLPFAFALALCAGTAAAHARKRPLHLVLATLFGVIALNFLLKPFAAAALGSGRTAKDYGTSAYAVFSQASTGILLIAAGLLVLLIVIQTTIHDYTHQSETDPLSGLLNRRGFDRLADRLLAARASAPSEATAIMIDIDYFKQINDTHGHDAGDTVIRDFAEILRQTLPRGALIARTGGDEFAVLLDRTPLRGGYLIAETIRQQLKSQCLGDRCFTLSQGVAQCLPGDALSDVMQRADTAAYRAKKAGRDTVVCWTDVATPLQSANVIPIRVAG